VVFAFLRRSKEDDPPPASIPRRVRIYAVGDIHGRADLLDRLLGQIARDARSAPGFNNNLIFLGDYVDRGPQSREVIDRLSAGPLPGFGAIYLRGNHETAMLDFLTGQSPGLAWLNYGGVATLESYGVRVFGSAAHAQQPASLRQALQQRLPRAHLSFLNHLRPYVTVGDYFFAHAGVRPGVPLQQQTADDLMWIRDPFLNSSADFGKIVVHGHTITDAPVIRANRIGIDTGAFASNRLTCLVLEGSGRRFLTT